MKKQQTDPPKPGAKVKVDKRLDQVDTTGWFQEKVDKANEILKSVGLPKGVVIR